MQVVIIYQWLCVGSGSRQLCGQGKHTAASSVHAYMHTDYV